MNERTTHFRPSVQAAARAMALAGWSLAAGCAGPGLSAGFDAPDYGARLHAVDDAVERNQREHIPELVALLESDDPVVRMLSIRALERMTGTTLDYEHWAPADERRAGVERWRAYLVAQGLKPSLMPADTDEYLQPEALGRTVEPAGGTQP